MRPAIIISDHARMSRCEPSKVNDDNGGSRTQQTGEGARGIKQGRMSHQSFILHHHHLLQGHEMNKF